MNFCPLDSYMVRRQISSSFTRSASLLLGSSKSKIKELPNQSVRMERVPCLRCLLSRGTISADSFPPVLTSVMK